MENNPTPHGPRFAHTYIYIHVIMISCMNLLHGKSMQDEWMGPLHAHQLLAQCWRPCCTHASTMIRAMRMALAHLHVQDV